MSGKSHRSWLDAIPATELLITALVMLQFGSGLAKLIVTQANAFGLVLVRLLIGAFFPDSAFTSYSDCADPADVGGCHSVKCSFCIVQHVRLPDLAQPSSKFGCNNRFPRAIVGQMRWVN